MRYRHLLEQQFAYLYHGTDINSACHIIRGGKIDGGQHYAHHPVGVSLTRDYVTALEFGRYWERDFPVVFVFDQEKLRQAQIKLFPRRDSSQPGEFRDREAEEMVLGELPLEPYLVSINIPLDELARAGGKGGESYRSYLQGEGWDELTKRKWKAQLSVLMKHPKLNHVVPRIDKSWRARQATTYGAITEAISTSSIDTAARKELQAHLLGFLDKEFNDFQRKNPSDRDIHDQYDAFYQHWSSDKPVDPNFIGGSITCRQAFVRRLCDQSSKCLTKVVQDHLGGDQVLVAGKAEISVQQFRVKIENREDSIDTAGKTANGYFRPTILDPMIKIFVNPDDVFAAGMDMVQVNLVGEGDDPEHLTNLIAPTFVHEYAHMQQFIRGDFGGDDDMGYIKVGGGKRGNRRYADRSVTGYLRYKGSAAEIQAFASGAASELIGDLSRNSYRDHAGVSDDDIAGVLEAIATGYADTQSVRGYTQLAWGHFKEEVEAMGIRPSELATTYRRFLKLVYRAVYDYRAKRLRQNGKRSPKETGWHIDRAPESWKAAARQNTLGRCASIIADEVMQELLVDDRPWMTGEEMARDERVSKAAYFLEAAYLDPEDYDSQRGLALMKAFRSLVARRIDANKEKLRHAA